MNNYVINHETRGHIRSDLHRYMYYSTYASVMGVSPTSSNLPNVMWPIHNNFSSGKFADRFKVQLKNNSGSTVNMPHFKRWVIPLYIMIQVNAGV